MFVEGGGVSWDTVDDFQYLDGVDTSAESIAVAPDDTIYVGGYGYDLDNGSRNLKHWIVHQQGT